MMSTAERMSVLIKYSVLPGSRIRFVPKADETVVQEITCGVLFVMAFWSGQSIQAFRRISAVLKELDPQGRLEFVVVDTDGCPALYDHAKFIGRMSGVGETAWIKNGQIVTTSGQGFNPECFGPNTIMLLSECGDQPTT